MFGEKKGVCKNKQNSEVILREINNLMINQVDKKFGGGYKLWPSLRISIYPMIIVQYATLYLL